jgi:hypothetical protein
MATSTTAIRSSTRKRKQVSYSADDYFDALDMEGKIDAISAESGAIAAQVNEEEVDDTNDDEPADGEFTRKVCQSIRHRNSPLTESQGKNKAPPKKKVKKIAKPKKPKLDVPFRFMDLPAVCVSSTTSTA